MSAAAVRRIVPLTVGWERLPKSYSVHGDTSGEILVEPVTAVALETGAGWTLIDTGMNTALVRDSSLYERLHARNHAIVPILPDGEGEPLADALAAHGVALGDISRIYLSHLHNDHAGGLRLFDRSVPVFVQRTELEYGMSGHPFPEQHGMFRIDYDDPLINWQLLDGDVALAPGVDAVFTPGHTPGHQSFVVELEAGGGYAFAFDAADLTENIIDERGPGGYVRCDAQDAVDSLLRLKAIAAARELPLIPGHDPVAWPALTSALATPEQSRSTCQGTTDAAGVRPASGRARADARRRRRALDGPVSMSARRSLDLQRLSGAYRAGELTPSALVVELLDRLDAADDDCVWITRVAPEELRARAADLDARLSACASEPLFGIPFAVKDNIDVAGMPTTAGCPGFAYVAEDSAPVVERLLEAGALLVGKTNLDQFATGLVGTRSPYGVPRNPVDARLIPGGSSAGSAVAVSAGLVTFALGTDTAGSGRVPAACTNIVGLKPTRGLISTRGVVPACRSLDCVCVLALTVADARAVLAVAEGHDPFDPWSRRGQHAPSRRTGLRVGVPMTGQLDVAGDTEAAERYQECASRLELLGATLAPIDLAPFTAAGELLYGGPWLAERLTAMGDFLATRPEAVHPITRAVLEPGWSHSAVDAFRAAHRLAELRLITETVWEEIDVLLVPSTPAVYTIEEVAADPLSTNARLGAYTNFVNLLDLCALAVPNGFRTDGAPLGVTLIAPALADDRLAEVAQRLQHLAGLPLGATGHSLPACTDDQAAGSPAALETIDLVVVGAHLTGEALNHQLTDVGGQLIAATRTARAYRLHALPGGSVPRPGLVRVSANSDDGAAIDVEVWAMSPAAFGAFVAAVAPPLTIGTVTLADGAERKGFLCEAHAAHDAPDISHFGGWRAYRAATDLSV